MSDPLTTAGAIIRAPWAPEHVAALRRHQADPRFHPYTCENRGDGKHYEDGLLVPTAEGWVCPWCSYTQAWAWRPIFHG